MEKDKKGLADTQEGEFILNERGTSVSTDPVEGIDIPASDQQKSETTPNAGQPFSKQEDKEGTGR